MAEKDARQKRYTEEFKLQAVKLWECGKAWTAQQSWV